MITRNNYGEVAELGEQLTLTKAKLEQALEAINELVYYVREDGEDRYLTSYEADVDVTHVLKGVLDAFP